jgi:5'-deoxynucleotidase YfbR-like HD superfamily hydrolase
MSDDECSLLPEVLHLGRLANALGAVDRGLNREDGAPESDTDHSVMVSWLACSLAARWYPALDVGLVAQLAVVHDAVEVYAGDTYAVGLTSEGKQQKEERERAALRRLETELPGLNWLTELIAIYEKQELPEARFVWAVDKLVTKVSCVFDGCAEVSKRVTMPTRLEFLNAEAGRMQVRVADFPRILQLREELIREAQLRERCGLSQAG